MSRGTQDFFKRKIQKFSKYSYAITLPNDWIKRFNLQEPEDVSKSKWKKEVDPTVIIYEMPDGHLEIYPVNAESGKKKPKIAVLDLDEHIEANPNFIEEKTIQMILISYYMNGSPGLEIISKKPIPDKLLKQIENTQSKLLFNWNMSKLSSRKVVVKNVFTERPEDIFREQIPQFLRESFAIIIGILEDFIHAIETKDFSVLKTVPERDDKIDRYYFFTVRQIRTVFERPKLRRPLNYSHKKLVDLRLLTKFIEDVGDLFKDTALILYRIHEFLQETGLLCYLKEYFKILYDDYSLLADELRISLSKTTPTIGLNEKIMDLIGKFRKEGKLLEQKWYTVISKIVLGDLIANYEFEDFYQGSRLVKNLEEIFKKMFDFTNLFF